MSQEMTPFDFEGQEVRTVTQDGEPWFVLGDVLAALGITRRAAAVSERLEDDVRQAYPIRDALGREQRAIVVNEAGLYEVVMRSDAANARPFRRWVTHEVLPAIRRHGGYLTDSKVEEFLTDPDTLIQLATNLKEERAARVRADKGREAMECYARELEPKSEAYDAFIAGDGTYSIGSVAKMHGISQNKLFNLMRAGGVMIAKGAMRNTPYQKYMQYFAVKAYDFTRSDGTTGTSYTTRVQPSGVDFLRRKLSLTPAPEVQA